MSVWVKRGRTGVDERIFIASDIGGAGSDGRFLPGFNTSNQFLLYGRNSSGTEILNLVATTTAITDTNWHHILASIDLSVDDAAHRYIYIDDVAQTITRTTFVAGNNLNFGSSDDFVVAKNQTPAASGYLDAALSELYINIGTFLDLSDSANRRKFITAALYPEDLGADGSTPTGSAPEIYLSDCSGNNDAGTTSDFTPTGSPTSVAGPQDTTNPVVTITSPTSSPTYAYGSNALDLAGTASDVGGVASVTIVSDTTGPGVVVGTTSWTVDDLELIPGDNVITVTATDEAGNTGTDVITVTYAIPPEVESTCPVDGATIQNDDSVIRVTFDVDMDDTTFAAGIDVVQDGATAVAGTWSYDDSDPFVATFVPDDPLEFDSIYTVTVTTAVESAIGVAMDADYVFRFRTRKAVNWADREPFQLVEIVQPLCSRTYGSAPCTASVGVTGDRKCYNTRKTCQDAANYDASNTVTWRFCRPAMNIPHRLFETGSGNTVSTNPLPFLVSVSTSPTYINVSGNSENEAPMGRRASVSVRFKDAPFDDHVGDPYLADRDFAPMTRGSFWAKWIARNPYHSNYILRVYDGYVNQPLSKMTVREYFIDAIEGPDSSGGVRVTAKDILRLADDKRALFPPVTEISLNQDIDNSQTTGIYVDDPSAATLYVMGNSADRYIRVDKEIIKYSTGDLIEGTTYQLLDVERGALNTDADEHRENQNMQRCGRYEDLECWEVAEDLLDEWTTIPDAYIDSAGWDTEGAAYLVNFNVTGTVAEPTPVIELLGEIATQCGFYIWWDERQKLIRIKAIRPETETIPALTDCTDVLADSVAISEESKQRLSRVFIYYNQRNPVLKDDEVGNYDSVQGRIDLDAEDSDQYGESRTKRIYSRWLTSDSVASQIAGTLLRRFRDNPRYVTISVDARTAETLWTADVVDLEHRNLVDDTGAKLSWRGQIISSEAKAAGDVVEYVLQRFEFTGRFLTWMEDAAPDFSVASEAEILSGGFWSDDDGLMGDGSEGYKWQ